MVVTVTLRGGSGDMSKSVYDPNLDGVIALAELDTLINKISALNADADLAMGANNITLDAAQTVDGKDITNLINKATGEVTATASDSLKFSSDSEVSHSLVSWVVKKTVFIPFRYNAGSVFRVYFELRISSTAAVASGSVFKNGVEVGSVQTHNGTAYTPKTQDLAFNPGDKMEVKIHISDSLKIAYLRNFRVKCGLSSDDLSW